MNPIKRRLVERMQSGEVAELSGKVKKRPPKVKKPVVYQSVRASKPVLAKPKPKPKRQKQAIVNKAIPAEFKDFLKLMNDYIRQNAGDK